MNTEEPPEKVSTPLPEDLGSSSSNSQNSGKSQSRTPWVISGIVILLAVVGAGIVFTHRSPHMEQPSEIAKPVSSGAVAKQGYDLKASQGLTGGNCSGTGSAPIIAPMKLDQVGSIQPYGLMVGGHVTPVDHQYYTGPDPRALRDTYDVLVPVDGTIVSIQHRGDKTNTPLHSVDVPSSDEYRLVIAHSCSFLVYVDLVTSLDDSLKAKLPAGWSPQTIGNGSLNIPVKQGEVIGHIGGQTLDFAVWDLTKAPLPGLLSRASYDSAEPWKVFTVAPSNYFADSIKAQVLAKYVRTVEPIDGKIDYDQDGKLIGNWFQVGTNGYEGGKSKGVPAYYASHIAIAPNFIDPSVLVVSLGSYSKSGDAEQFGIKGNAPDPATINVASGLVKYELVQQEIDNPDGTVWQGATSQGVKIVNRSQVKGVVLFQLLEDRKLKMEVFPDKTAAQVSGFDGQAVFFDRGDGAKEPVSNTAT